MKLDASGRAPRVSALVPAFNVAPYLERALGSALAQTMTDLEVIVVDDASADDTLCVAQRIARRDRRVRVLRNERNLGEAATRCLALAAARGEWVAPLDGDDAWLPERLDRLLAASDGADVVADDVYRVEPGRELGWSCLRYRWHPPVARGRPFWITARDFIRHDLGILQPIVRREFLQRHRITWNQVHRLSPDFFFAFDLLLSGARWLQLPEGYYLYYARRDSALACRWLSEGPDVIRAKRALTHRPAVKGDPTLVAELRRSLAEEDVSFLFEQARVALREQRPATLLGVLFGKPLTLPQLTVHAARRLRAWRARKRHRFAVRLALGRTACAGPVLPAPVLR